MIKSTQRWDVLTLNWSKQLCRLNPVCTWDVPRSCVYMTPGHITVNKIRQWNGFSRVVKPVAPGNCLSYSDKLFYSKWIIYCKHAILTTNYIPLKRLQTCGSKWNWQELHYIRPCVYVCHSMLGTYSISTVLIQYHTVRTTLLLAKICNFHIYYIFFSAIYIIKYHPRAHFAKIS